MNKNVYSMERSSEYLIRRAKENAQLGNFAQAITLLRLAAQKGGMDTRMRERFAKLYSQIGCYEKANSYLYEIMQTDVEMMEECYFRIGENYFLMEDTARAMEFLLLYLSSDSDEAHFDASHDMIEYIQSLDDGDTRSERAQHNVDRAMVALENGEVARGQRSLMRAQRFGDDAGVHSLIALTYMSELNCDEAVKHARIAVKKKPKGVRMLCVLSSAYAFSGDEKAAKRALLRAVVCSKGPKAWMMAAQCACEMNLHQLARTLYARIVCRQPYDTLSAHMYAIASLNTGNVRSAQKCWGRMLSVLPDDPMFDYYYRYASSILRGEQQLGEPIPYTLSVPRKETRRRIELLYKASALGNEDMRAFFAKDPTCLGYVRWLLHTPALDLRAAKAALSILIRLGNEMAYPILLESLTSDRLDAAIKRIAVGILKHWGHDGPFFAQIDGILLQVWAQSGAQDDELTGDYDCILRQAVDSVGQLGETATKRVMDMWTCYIESRGDEAARLIRPDVWAFSLEWAYHQRYSGGVSEKLIARGQGVTHRLVKRFGKKILAVQKERASNEMHKL